MKWLVGLFVLSFIGRQVYKVYKKPKKGLGRNFRMKEKRSILSIEKVIKVTVIRDNPDRVVIQYYSMDGDFIFELEPIN